MLGWVGPADSSCEAKLCAFTDFWQDFSERFRRIDHFNDVCIIEQDSLIFKVKL